MPMKFWNTQNMVFFFNVNGLAKPLDMKSPLHNIPRSLFSTADQDPNITSKEMVFR